MLNILKIGKQLTNSFTKILPKQKFVISKRILKDINIIRYIFIDLKGILIWSTWIYNFKNIHQIYI